MEASPEQSAEGSAIVGVLATVLDRLVCANAPIARDDPGQVTKFHAMKAPGIGIRQYLERIQKYASCSNECFILALIYIDRLIQRNNFLLTELNVHRVVITGILLAAKFFDDAYYNNAYYAKVGGVLVSEINGLEVDFLFRINFSLHVSPEEFDKYRAELLLHSTPVPMAAPPSTAAALEPCQHQFHQTSPGMPSPTLVVEGIPVMTYQRTSDPIKVAAQITPSPPVSAGRMADDPLMNFGSTQIVDQCMFDVPTAGEAALRPIVHVSFERFTQDGNNAFSHLHRANSLPVNKTAASAPLPMQQQRHPASVPVIPRRCSPNIGMQQPVGPIHYPPVLEDYVIIGGAPIYPIQPTLVHHHHHGFGHQDGAGGYVTQVAQQRMLTGLSGAVL